MSKPLIKISYRQVIDRNNESLFEQNVFNASYAEFLMKSQAYNMEGKYKTFTQLKAADGRANSLHYKSGFAVGGFIETLNKKIPSLQDASGQAILFDTWRFELIESDITDKFSHKLAIHYITGTLTLLESFGDNLLLAYGDKTAQLTEGIEDSFILKLMPGVSVISYKL